MKETRLGQLITEPQTRDAIHIAVAPVTAGEKLIPGQHVGFINAAKGLVGVSSKPIGIVDPFLERAVRKGEEFYMLLYPGSITSLSHHWSHPEFTDQVSPEMAASKQWLQDLADECGLDYEDLLRAIPSGRIHTGSNEMYGARDSDDIAHHFFVVTGIKVPGHIGFSCAC